MQHLPAPVVALALLLPLVPQTKSATKLAGSWKLDTLTIDRVRAGARGQPVIGTPIIDTEVHASPSADESRNIQVADNVVTVVTTSRMPLLWGTNARYE